jgi:hypothetical protein
MLSGQRRQRKQAGQARWGGGGEGQIGRMEQVGDGRQDEHAEQGSWGHWVKGKVGREGFGRACGTGKEWKAEQCCQTALAGKAELLQGQVGQI